MAILELINFNNINEKTLKDSLSSYCRICLQRKPNILDYMDDGKLFIIANVKLTPSESKVCAECQQNIETTYEFIRLIKSSDAFVKSLSEVKETVELKPPRKRGRKPKIKVENDINLVKNEIKDESVYFVVWDEDEKKLTSLVTTEHSYPTKVDSSLEITNNDNLIEFVKNFGSEGLSDTQEVPTEIPTDQPDENETKANLNHKIFRIYLGNFICEVCDASFDMLEKYIEHFENIHPRVMPTNYNIRFTCPICDAKFLDDQQCFNKHLAEHREENYYFLKVNENGKLLSLTDREMDTFIPYEELLEVFGKVPQVCCDKCDLGKTEYSVLDCIDCKEKQHTLSDKQDENTFFCYFNQETSQIDLSNRKELELAAIPLYTPCISKRNAKHIRCSDCSKIFQNKTALVKHLKLHKGEYCCEKCGKIFKKERDYLKHYRLHEQNRNLKQCQVCSKHFKSKKSLILHSKCHMEGGNCTCMCATCGKIFKYKSSLAGHVRKHFKNVSHKCLICNFGCHTLELYERHVNKHKDPNCIECDVCKMPLSTQKAADAHALLHSMSTNPTETFDCAICNVSFLSQNSLSLHQSHTKHQTRSLSCNVCQEVFLSVKLFRNHIKTHPSYKSTQCHLCDKRLSTTQSLSFHLARHYEELTILCPHCGKKFFEKKNFERHLLTHEGVRPYKCDVPNCAKGFFSPAELKRHMDYHEGTRNYRCTYCGKAFIEANQLTVHIRIHTGDRPYTCPHCARGFVTRTRCKQHIKASHNGEGYDLIETTITKKVPVFQITEES